VRPLPGRTVSSPLVLQSGVLVNRAEGARVSAITALRRRGRPTGASAPPIVLLVAAAVSVQGGAALATTLFDRAGPAGAAWLRIILGAAVLVLVTRAWRPGPTPAPGAIRWAVALGLVLAGMNTSFYFAIDRLPLGVAVAVEFIGPMAVAVASSRRPADLAWVGLAAASVAALTLPRADLGSAEFTGVGLAALAGLGWALYIVSAKGLGRAWPGRRGLVLAMLVAAVATTPGGVVSAGGAIGPELLLVALAVGILGTAVPYSLELAAIRRVSRGAFGVMMALEPAVAAAVGLVFLGQVLGPLDLAGIVGVGVAVWGVTARPGAFAERAAP
jgi:inner membrane transporter RhtA